MHFIIEKNKCSGCFACFNKCSQNAIKMKTDEKGFKYPIITQKDALIVVYVKKYVQY
jgi:MinD superfamily P-loop ATPase containing an inserted ferredoxin domain